MGKLPACTAVGVRHPPPCSRNPRCSWTGEAHSQAWLSKAMPFLEKKFLVPTSGLSGAKPSPRTSIISTSLPRALSCTPIQSLRADFRDNRWHLGATPPVSAGMRWSAPARRHAALCALRAAGPSGAQSRPQGGVGPSQQGPARLECWSVAGKERRARGAYCW